MGIDVNDLVSVVGWAPQAGRGEELRAGDVVEGLVRSGATRGRLTARDHVTAVADAAPQGLDGRDVVRLAGAVGSALGSRRRDDGPGSWSGAIDPVGRVPGVARGPGGDPAGPVRTPPGDGPGRRTGRAPGDGSAPGVRPPLELGR